MARQTDKQQELTLGVFISVFLFRRQLRIALCCAPLISFFCIAVGDGGALVLVVVVYFAYFVSVELQPLQHLLHMLQWPHKRSPAA
jgi:hypothetical protein